MSEEEHEFVIRTAQQIVLNKVVKLPTYTEDGLAGIAGQIGPTGAAGDGTDYVLSANLTSAVSSHQGRINAINAKKLGAMAHSLLNGWVNFGGGWQAAGSVLDGDIVTLYGLVGGAASTATTILNLPVERRPAKEQMFAVCTGDPVTTGRIDIAPNGNVRQLAGITGYVSLNGISFYIA